jgi:hypothetical protein
MRREPLQDRVRLALIEGQNSMMNMISSIPGFFDQGRYFEVLVEYAKADA